VAIDNSENLSETPSTASITPVIYPITPTGFTAIQNGENVLLVWDDNAANDIAGFELRTGATFNSGSLLITGLKSTTYEFSADSEGLKRYHIKAINNAGNYSKQAATAEVTITNLPGKNIIFTFDEISFKSGTHSNTQFGTTSITCLTLPGYCSDYQGYTCDGFGTVGVLKLALNGSNYYPSGIYQTTIKDMGDIITARISCNFASPNILLNTGIAARLEFRISTNGTTWGDWKPFMPTIMTFRYVQFQVLLTTDNVSKSPEIGQFTDAIDVPDTPKEGITIVSVGGATINFGNTYHVTPVFLPTAIGSGVRCEVVSVDLSSAIIKVVKALTGEDVGGIVHWRVNGY
jgi:hypothetical protein